MRNYRHYSIGGDVKGTKPEPSRDPIVGKKDPRSIRIDLKISHEELSEMVETTRPRISMFMQRFYNLGLIQTNEDHFLIVKENQLTACLAQIA
jgi:hypothetical protein